MFNKLYDNFKQFIKENYKIIIFLIIFAVIMNYPLDYSIMASGGTININDRVNIENEYESKGTLNLAYVTELKGTIPTVLLSYIIPEWEKVPLSDYKANDSETSEDIDKRGKISLKMSEDAAIKVAYEKANKTFNIKNSNYTIYYLSEEVTENIKVGDVILKIDGDNLTSFEQYIKLVNSKNIGDSIKLLIKRDNKEFEIPIKIRNIDNQKKLGIAITLLYDYDTDPKITLDFKGNESGSSGGLMLTLAIYNKLVNEDITKGKKIVGTGTIDSDGNVGEIDGVKYKLKGAVKGKADIFIVPYGDNYNECIKLKEEKDYDIEIIGVKTFDEALNKLSNIN